MYFELFCPLHLFPWCDIQVIYVSVRGVEHVNVFSIIIWDRIFNEEEYTLYVPEGVEGYLVIDLSAEISIPNERYETHYIDKTANADTSLNIY